MMILRTGIRSWLMLSALLLFTTDALGAVVYIKGQKEPVAGFVESADDMSIRLRIVTPEGEELNRQILRSEIDLLLQPVSPSRLSQLSPDNPKAYREYAEELVEKQTDPEAVETAKRLFMIAAHLDPQNEGRSALLGMTPLMNDSQGVKQLRAMAYLIDPSHDASLLEGKQQEVTTGAALDEAVRQEVTKVLHLLRRGERADARQQLNREEIRSAMRQGTSKITLDECLALAQGNCPGCEQGKIPTYMLQKLVAAELELSTSQVASEVRPQWGFFLDSTFQKPLPVLSLAKAIGFDPRQCVYRNGAWVEPTK
ncbi:hypothetical protein C5Y96_08005 [Blastopirellula marina]|uniref:Uncharacterized protein n=1 Tax=Blastopirellula marina TaxID=124 RepID=A0A2S8FY46_9BACT|nr:MULTISPECIES: hypothetical protein [Pirellulaceae]PQO37092.1 hypothetical protein C5Y96_08005 [Blastopirellula marina]RCS53807.1 hypothetical protein DTL36_08015 [Bremerella cremea]